MTPKAPIKQQLQQLQQAPQQEEKPLAPEEIPRLQERRIIVGEYLRWMLLTKQRGYWEEPREFILYLTVRVAHLNGQFPTVSQLAELTGEKRQTVGPVLNRLVDKGSVARHGRGYFIPRKDLLRSNNRESDGSDALVDLFGCGMIKAGLDLLMILAADPEWVQHVVPAQRARVPELIKALQTMQKAWKKRS